MKKLRHLFTAFAVMLTSGVWAQNDVTNTYLNNADFSSINKWTADVSASYNDYGNGLIGTYQVRGDLPAATVDETHLATEYCIGLECRWSGNYASLTQVTAELPAGYYTLSFDVENANGSTTSANYDNLFFVEYGDKKITDSSKEWMSGKSNWTTHEIKFVVTEAIAATISLGYGTGSNNIGSANTPAIYVSHLKLTWADPITVLKQDLGNEIANATSLKDGFEDAIKPIFNADIEAANTVYNNSSASEEDLYNALTALEEAEEVATAANTLYVDAEQRAVETGVTLPAIASYADVYLLHKQVYQAVVAEYSQNGASFIPAFSEWTGDAVRHNPGQGWRDANEQYYYEQTGSDWGSSSWNRHKETTVTLPAGKYAFIIYGRGSTEATVSATVGETTVSIATKGDIGRGVNTSGEASYDPADEYTRDGQGYGWDVRYVLFESTGEELTLRVEGSASTNHQWMSFTEPVLLTTADNIVFAKENLLNQITTAQGIYDAAEGVGDGILQIPVSAWEALGEAITAALNVYNNGSATTADVNAAIEALVLAVNTYTTTELTAPDADKVYAVKNASITEEDRYLSLVNGEVKITSVKQGLKFEATEGGYYLTDGEQYVGLAGTNNWTMSALPDNKTVISITLTDGMYTLKESKGLIGTDSTEDGASCYADKPASKNGYWTIEEIPAEATALSEDVTYTEAGIYADATLTRTINEGWNALMLPFAVDAATFGSGAVLALYTGDEINDEQLTLNFASVSEVAANTPFLLHAPAAMTTLNYTGILINAKHDVAGTNFDFVGFYGAETSPIANGDYIIAGGIIKKAQGGNAIKPYRAYFKAKGSEGESRISNVIFNIDGVATGISDAPRLTNESTMDNVVYSLSGMRMNSKLQKGVYIQNGRKLVVK